MIVESAFLATFARPCGSLDFLSTMSCSTYLTIGCFMVIWPTGGLQSNATYTMYKADWSAAQLIPSWLLCALEQLALLQTALRESLVRKSQLPNQTCYHGHMRPHELRHIRNCVIFRFDLASTLQRDSNQICRTPYIGSLQPSKPSSSLNFSAVCLSRPALTS